MAETQTVIDQTINPLVLREQGLKYLQALSGQIWTDHNIHDPGVTILETLVSAIIELDSRLSLNIKDILADKPGSQTGKRFFSPGQILTINPVTINDYRKLLIDIPGVKNAWLSQALDVKPDLYFDKDNNCLLYDYAQGAQKIKLNGLYRVSIEKERDISDNDILKLAVKEKLYNHRNLCEDFCEINIMEQETVYLYTDIKIDEECDSNELAAQIYFALENFISPHIRQYSLQKMYEKGKSTAEIFSGPVLENGFIDEKELDQAEKRKELHASDLVRIIMSFKDVKDVRNLFISNKPNADMSDKKEWALVLDDTKALLLEAFNNTKIRLFKNGIMTPVSNNKVFALTGYLRNQSKIDIFNDRSMDLEEPAGNYSDLAAFQPITYKLPSLYGISETGLPSNASDKRKAQAKQLRAYYLFFEQLLAGYFKQLDSFKNIFRLKQNREDLLKTYISQLLPEIEWKTDFPEIAQSYEYLEDNPMFVPDDPAEQKPAEEGGNAFKRKNRILNHLIALFNEKFADYALFGYNNLQALDPLAKKNLYLKAKSDFMENWPSLGRNRNRADKGTPGNTDTNTGSGLKRLIGSKLGLDAYHAHELANFHIIEHILLRPDGNLPLNFICSEKIKEVLQPDPYSYQLTFVISKKTGRFSNNKFKELVYNTIETETPSHISYNILELDFFQMNRFTDLYYNFLNEFYKSRQENYNQNNPYRNSLIELLGIGQVKLPVIHLDANNPAGDGTLPANESPLELWKDLSRNNHNAVPFLNEKPVYIKIDDKHCGFVRFKNKEQLKIVKSLVSGDFTIIIVYNASVDSREKEGQFPLICGADSAKDNFGIFFMANGSLTSFLNQSRVSVNSTLNIPHIALFSRNKQTGKETLFIDGTLVNSITSQNLDIFLSQETLVIGTGADMKASCEIGEIIILDFALTGSRKTIMEEYLSAKWRIALSAVSSINKPVIHLDAANSESISRDFKTNRIKQWNDLGANDLNPSGENFPVSPLYLLEGINGFPAIDFTTGCLVIPDLANNNFFTGDFTIAIIYKTEVEQGILIDAVDKAETGSGFFIGLGNKGSIHAGTSSWELSIKAGHKDPHMMILCARVLDNKLTLSLSIDSRCFTEKTFSNTLPAGIGTGGLVIGRNFSGIIGEIVIYDNALPVPDRQRLEDYFSNKWKISLSGTGNDVFPAAHFDASRLETVRDEKYAVFYNATKVYQWIDLGSLKNNAVQNNINRRPSYSTVGINGLGAVHFTQAASDTSDIYEDSLNLPLIIENDFTIMIVFKADYGFYSSHNIDVNENTPWTEGSALFDADCSGFYNDFGISIGCSNNNFVIMAGIGDRVMKDHTIQTGALDLQTAHFVTFTRELATGMVKLYADGLLSAEADLRDNVVLNDSKTIKIGAFNSEGIPFHGHIGEIILFNKVLTSMQRQQIENYISGKWNIPVKNLPVQNILPSLHFDAANTGSITKDKENKVSGWEDIHDLQGAVAVQKAKVNQPLYNPSSINGMPALRFNNSFLTINPEGNAYNDFTIALVFNALSSGNIYPDWKFGAGILDNFAGDTSEYHFGIAINKDNKLTFRSGWETFAADCALNTPHILVINRNKVEGKIQIYIDGLLVLINNPLHSNISLNGSDGLTIGAIHRPIDYPRNNAFFHGDLSEVILFNEVLDIVNRQSLEKYLSMKWKIDISGINKISKPILHLDAAKISTVIKNEPNNAVSKWLDINGCTNDAAQPIASKQPLYVTYPGNELPMIHFDSISKNYFTLPRVVQDDFTIIVVYKADSDLPQCEYMPVSKDSFTCVAGIDKTLSESIWNNLYDKEINLQGKAFIDINGSLLSSFTPGEQGFSLGLKPTIFTLVKPVFESEIIKVLMNCITNTRTVIPASFASIPGINETLSSVIWDDLDLKGYINSDGNILPAFRPLEPSFHLSINLDLFVETALINLLLTENWFEGAGLIDANCPGDTNDIVKRDFGLLIGKGGTLIAGIGVPGDKDYKIAASSSPGIMHIGIFTRRKDTGVVKLYVDKAPPVTSRFARGISLKDSNRMSIACVNAYGNYFKGDIAEIIILDVVPLENEIELIQDYLIKKWM